MVYGRYNYDITIDKGVYISIYIHIWLVVFHPTPLKNDGVEVSWDYSIPNIWKNKKCSKPTTSISYLAMGRNLV
jgi:hypothetical protein